ncbi:hypothetical protein BZF66_05550 [Salmonella enterica]|uniref:hypothetical protein n=1 Tax=Salmonella enterica TaxID=28901 RepID=UPI000FDF6F36|nr:hypothetical protein CPT_Munch_485 [Salmonella phage Munch]EAZ2022756.1 hypothetical protein [Salmonella enterica]ECV9083890.1 hypothetical protein [Salmonella enterica subsp. enterica serovar Infantis]MCP0435513.1 hypothetical protein [Salmonella enterica subsp. enterica serovar Mbandaka]EIN7543446.1 hypothetical protein [Salmonella enterica]
MFKSFAPWDKKPEENGAYIVVVYSRDGVPVMRIAFYDVESNTWTQQHIEEYGYATTSKLNDNIISYYKKIDGVSFEVIPESYNIKMDGVKLNEDDE